MSLELSLEDIEIILAWECLSHNGCNEQDGAEKALIKRLDKELERLNELAELDFDDCAGGACKL